MSLDERWLPVVGYEGRYEVSSLGRVKSLSAPGVKGWRAREFIMRTPLTNTGYCQLQLCLNGKQRQGRVHVLVCEAFLGPRPEGHHAAHINGKRDDNRLENLMWADPRMNAIHRVFHEDRGIDGRRPNKRRAVNVSLERIERLVTLVLGSESATQEDREWAEKIAAAI